MRRSAAPVMAVLGLSLLAGCSSTSSDGGDSPAPSSSAPSPSAPSSSVSGAATSAGSASATQPGKTSASSQGSTASGSATSGKKFIITRANCELMSKQANAIECTRRGFHWGKAPSTLPSNSPLPDGVQSATP